MSCGDPGSLVNGFRIGDKFTYEERVIYDCDAGYKLQGSIIRKCEGNGQWSGSTASCVGEELQMISKIYTRLWKIYHLCHRFCKNRFALRTCELMLSLSHSVGVCK